MSFESLQMYLGLSETGTSDCVCISCVLTLVGWFVVLWLRQGLMLAALLLNFIPCSLKFGAFLFSSLDFRNCKILLGLPLLFSHKSLFYHLLLV